MTRKRITTRKQRIRQDLSEKQHFEICCFFGFYDFLKKDFTIKFIFEKWHDLTKDWT